MQGYMWNHVKPDPKSRDLIVHIHQVRTGPGTLQVIQVQWKKMGGTKMGVIVGLGLRILYSVSKTIP